MCGHEPLHRARRRGHGASTPFSRRTRAGRFCATKWATGVPLRGMVAAPVSTVPCVARGSAHGRRAGRGEVSRAAAQPPAWCPSPPPLAARRGAAQPSALHAVQVLQTARRGLLSRRCHGGAVALRRAGRGSVLTSALGAAGGGGGRGTATPFERLSEGSMSVVTSAVAEASRLQSSEVRACGFLAHHTTTRRTGLTSTPPATGGHSPPPPCAQPAQERRGHGAAEGGGQCRRSQESLRGVLTLGHVVAAGEDDAPQGCVAAAAERGAGEVLGCSGGGVAGRRDGHSRGAAGGAGQGHGHRAQGAGLAGRYVDGVFCALLCAWMSRGRH